MFQIDFTKPEAKSWEMPRIHVSYGLHLSYCMSPVRFLIIYMTLVRWGQLPLCNYILSILMWNIFRLKGMIRTVVDHVPQHCCFITISHKLWEIVSPFIQYQHMDSSALTHQLAWRIWQPRIEYHKYSTCQRGTYLHIRLHGNHLVHYHISRR